MESQLVHAVSTREEGKKKKWKQNEQKTVKEREGTSVRDYGGQWKAKGAWPDGVEEGGKRARERDFLVCRGVGPASKG